MLTFLNGIYGILTQSQINIFIYLLLYFQMRTFLQIWLQKNRVQELKIVLTNLEESLCPREQFALQRQTWRYISKNHWQTNNKTKSHISSNM